ncbi:MAG TPA: hypothetical protein VEN81_11485 [Planctomycetota bacterium]|nr:hypothetical protein [Planctomycetota bacterium]
MRRLAALWLPFMTCCAFRSSVMTDGAPKGLPSPDEARVVIYGDARTEPFPIYSNKELVGYAEGRCFFELSCEPGEHAFSSIGHKGLFEGGVAFEAVVIATLAAGKTYFIRAHGAHGSGCNGGFHPMLHPISCRSDEWDKVERLLRRYQLRSLPEGTLARIKATERGLLELTPEGSRLNPEDGR